MWSKEVFWCLADKGWAMVAFKCEMCWHLNWTTLPRIFFFNVCLDLDTRVIYVRLGRWKKAITLFTLLFSHLVMFDSLRPHGLQHTKLPCPPLSPGVCPCSYPLSQWCYPIISLSATLLSFCLQSFPYQGLLQWFSSSHQVAKMLQLQLQHQSFQWIFRTDFL